MLMTKNIDSNRGGVMEKVVAKQGIKELRKELKKDLKNGEYIIY